MRPDFHVLFSGFQNQINVCLVGGTDREWRRRRVNAPEPVSSKSMSLKRSKIRELETESTSDQDAYHRAVERSKEHIPVESK